jgi:MFS family permease
VAILSIATLLVAFSSSFSSLLILRLMLGLAESAAFPCASKLLAQAVEPRRLGVANGAMSFGYLLGPAVGTLLGGLLMDAFGWRSVFLLLGAASLAWLWPWRAVVVGPSAQPPPPGMGPSLRLILKQRALWGAAIGLFSANYSFYFVLAWLPFYLVKARGFSIETMAWTASWAYLLNAVFALLAGWLMDRWAKSRRSANIAYKSVMAVNHLVGVACMGAMLFLPAKGMIAALFAYEVMSGIASPGLYAIPQIIAGPHASARWVGVHNCIGAAAGIIAPALTGLLVQSTGQFGAAFMLAAAVSVFGLLAWTVILPRIAPIPWEDAIAQGKQLATAQRQLG